MNNKWYSLCNEDIIKILNSSPNGLTENEVNIRQTKYGKNSLPKEKEPTLFEIIIRQFKSPMVFVLLIAAIICLFINEFLDAIFIGVALFINAILGTYQEYNAMKNASSIQKLLKIKTRVIRDNLKIEVDSEELVPGDIVLLESGDKVPADIRLLEAHNLQLDESFLTGESIAVPKNIEIVSDNTPITDQTNMLFALSTVQSGRGMGIVVGTGLNTEIGNIAEDLVATKESKSPLTIRMEKFTRQILFLVIIFAVLSAYIMVTRDYPNYEIFLLVVAMCVSAIPESLPIAQTVVLSIATSKMAKKNVIVKKLSSVESLGSCTVIASDKTGTLTVNQQTAKIISLPDGTNIEVTGQGYNDEGKIMGDNLNHTDELKYLCSMGILNNEAVLEKKDGSFIHHGDSIDLAFLSLGLKNNINETDLNKFNIFGRIPYESENKFSAVFFEENNENYVTVKGSSETILEFCTSQRNNDSLVPLEYEKLEKEFLRLSAAGYRVIALAAGKYNRNKKNEYGFEDIKNLTFIGFVGFIDPIRSTSKNAIEKCHGAGIRVIMITGDHPLTSKSIAKELNLMGSDDWVVTGSEIEKAFDKDKNELIRLVKEHNVFARVSPIQKSLIVETLKEQGEFIAVTGDGINDAPALKKSNIGVAMGSGTDVTKDVSTMIITDDNFNSIVHAIEEGRFAYGNIRKVVYLLISTAFAEMALFTISIIFGLPPVFTTVQILWINLVTNGIQDIAIAFEKGESDVMKDPPKSTKEQIFDKLLIKESLLSAATMFTMVFIAWFVLNTRFDMPVTEARNYILLIMVLLQNFHAFNCRSEKQSAFKMPLKNNKFIVYAVAAALGLHLLFMYVPFLQDVLKTNPVSLTQFALAILMAVPLFFVMEIFKLINRKRKQTV